MNETLDFDKICRGCLCKKPDMRPLFGSSIDSMMHNVVDIEVTPNDNLPDKVCLQCMLQISRAFTFKTLCRRNDTLLRSQLLKNREKQFIDDALNNDCIAIDEIEEPEPWDNQQSSVVDFNEQPVAFNSSTSPVGGELAVDQATTILLLRDDGSNDSQSGNVEYTIESEYQIEDNVEMEIMTMDIVDGGFEVYSEDEEHDNLLVSVKNDMLSEEILKYFCVNCGLNYESEEQLTHHSESCLTTAQDTEQQPITDRNLSLQCDICLKKFTDQKALRRHLKIHLGVKPHVCNICSMSFTESSNLTKHKKKHSGELRNVTGKPHLCQVCGKGFKWQSSLSKHMKHHTKLKLFYCQYCPKYYVEYRSLQIHQRNHTGDRPFKCQYCTRSFTQKCNQEKHERVHTGSKPFKCTFENCDKKFSQSGYVQVHMRTHTGVKPYECECGKKFAASNTLAHHKKIHSGEKPFVCGIKHCNKKFTRNESMATHQRTKHADVPIACKLCDLRFTSFAHLERHVKIHENPGKLQCPSCNEEFDTNVRLKNHVCGSGNVQHEAITQIEEIVL